MSQTLTRVDSFQSPHYKPLTRPSDQTRVLRLLPGPPGSTIRAQLLTLDFDTTRSTHYEAVSYVWGRFTGTKDIEIGGHICIVPASSEDVLQAVRYRDTERLIWIDAICINQTDQTEKQHQVAIMGKIYQEAERTVFWLGDADEHTELAFKTMISIHDQARDNSGDCQHLREVLYGASNSFQYSTTPLPETCDVQAMEAVRQIFKRPWFTRRWIIQEAALSRDGLMCCGEHIMPIIPWFRAAVWIHHKQDHLPFDLEHEGGMLNASYMSAHVDREQGWFSRKHGQSQKLADLFRYFRTFDATVDHDRVYALFGLTQWHMEKQPLPDLIMPNYALPMSEVLADATRVATIEAGDLWLFRYIDLAEAPYLDQINAPSWVPQLFRSPNPDIDPNHLRSTFNASCGMASFDDMNKTFNLKPVEHDSRAISVEGFIVAQITNVGNVISKHQLDSPEAIAELLYTTVMDQQLVGHTGSITALSSLRPEEVGLVLLAGTHFDPEPSHTVQQSFGTFADFINTFYVAAAQSRDKVVALLEDRASARYIRGLRWAAMHRRLFSTGDGHFGLGPRAAREGDRLIILSASRMPMIMRKLRSEWRVVGPCYVYGIMRGEAVTTWKQRALDPETFFLR
jgi:hypothetical protein